MKKLLTTLIGAFAVSATHPVFAGPNWQLIEQARKAKAARMQQQAVQQPTTQAQACKEASKRIVLPLDHGPRAQTTPWLNQQRLRRAEEARTKACAHGTQMPDPQG